MLPAKIQAALLRLLWLLLNPLLRHRPRRPHHQSLLALQHFFLMAICSKAAGSKGKCLPALSLHGLASKS
jgi:hypothetical protein